MKLSEAMMLGGMTYELRSNCWEGCLLGVSVQALGANNLLNREANARWPWIEDFFPVPESLLRHFSETDKTQRWPARTIISNLAWAVQYGEITLEQAVDWVRQNEPAEPEQSCEVEEVLQSVKV